MTWTSIKHCSESCLWQSAACICKPTGDCLLHLADLLYIRSLAPRLLFALRPYSDMTFLAITSLAVSIVAILAGFAILGILGILGILDILDILEILSILALSFCFRLGSQYLSDFLDLLELACVTHPPFVPFTSVKPSLTLAEVEAFMDYLLTRDFKSLPYLAPAALDVGAIFDKEALDTHLVRMWVRFGLCLGLMIGKTLVKMRCLERNRSYIRRRCEDNRN
jgi:hypothetical protein